MERKGDVALQLLWCFDMDLLGSLRGEAWKLIEI